MLWLATTQDGKRNRPELNGIAAGADRRMAELPGALPAAGVAVFEDTGAFQQVGGLKRNVGRWGCLALAPLNAPNNAFSGSI